MYKLNPTKITCFLKRCVMMRGGLWWQRERWGERSKSEKKNQGRMVEDRAQRESEEKEKEIKKITKKTLQMHLKFCIKHLKWSEYT